MTISEARRPGTKMDLIRGLLVRGTTAKEVKEATGWKAVSMPAAARSLNLELRKYEERGVTKYIGVPIAGLSKLNGKAKTAKFINRGEAEEPETPTKRGHGKLLRVPFTVSRLMEFCTERELVNQTGHETREWGLVILKELVDNAIDACEEAEIAPDISIAVKDGWIVIRDNGPGIPAETINGVLNYTIRVSSREAYVSPTRGAQGNALKTILPMGYVLDECRGEAAAGQTLIESHGVAHHITFSVDHIKQEPKITHATKASKIVRGTRVTIKLPESGAGYVIGWREAEFLALAESFAWLNPHLSLRVSWDGEEKINVKASNPAWGKWSPSWPTSAHWYNEGRFRRYMAAHIAHRGDVTVRKFISEFDGLTAIAKQKIILEELGASHVKLHDWFGRDRVNERNVKRLLAALKAHSTPVPPRALGSIGKDHFQRLMEGAGGDPRTFKYERRLAETDGIPRVVEVAFGMHRNDAGGTRKLITGVNWSPGIKNPFRHLGQSGEGLDALLMDARANIGQPVIMVVHLACPRVQYVDRGKSAIVVEEDDA
jgi:DNA topoisomerase VI subunit B